jgi:hypothetical protein
MCFSAGASFAGGAVLSAIGVATMRKVQHPSQRLLASTPMLFAFQQFAEGVVWLTLKSGEHALIQSAAGNFFLLMALVIWPSMMPLAVMKLEQNIKRKKIIAGFLAAGIIVSLYYAVCLISFNANPKINGFHIQYVNDFPIRLGFVVFGLYISATIVPLFISTVKRMSLFGILVLLSCLITGVFYKEFLTSVWCFFAALISVVIYVIVNPSHVEEGEADPAMQTLKSRQSVTHSLLDFIKGNHK